MAANRAAGTPSAYSQYLPGTRHRTSGRSHSRTEPPFQWTTRPAAMGGPNAPRAKSAMPPAPNRAGTHSVQEIAYASVTKVPSG